MGAGEQIFTFIAVRADGATPVLDIASCANEAAAFERAASWLSTHSSCERVQVWSERELIGEVAGPCSGGRPSTPAWAAEG